MPASRTHPISKRDIHFDLTDVDLDHWHPGGFHTSHYFNVQSLLFPQGERFFIRSVRHFRDQITDPVLQDQVAGFIGQEAMHGREHDAYNEQLARWGYDVAAMDRLLARSFDWTERFMSPKFKLAMTVALEHLTAIGAESLLSDSRILNGADPEMARLWRWHAMEETEHKAVAFDVYREVAGAGAGGWLRRCTALLLVSLSMQLTIWVVLIRISARKGRLLQLSGWARLFGFLWAAPGALRQEIPRYFRFFVPRFHPWYTDNYADVQQLEAAYREHVGARPDMRAVASAIQDRG